MANNPRRSSETIIRGLLARWPEGITLVVSGLLLFSGVVHMACSFRESQTLDILDPIFLIPFRYMILVVGWIEIGLAYLYLFTQRRLLFFRLMSVLLFIVAVYRIGLLAIGWYHPYVFVGPLTEALAISPRMADVLLMGAIALLTAVSGAVAWHTSRTAPPPEVLRMLCPDCGQRVQFSMQTMGQEVACPHCHSSIKLVSPGKLKMTCFLCKGHIEFSSAILGRKIGCPHCKATITLMRPQNIKMSCPSCNGHIEFPLDGLGQTVSCPHCAANVTLQMPLTA
jgi:DNA-directed RNA polymerase subunit RPC12/RpoP